MSIKYMKKDNGKRQYTVSHKNVAICWFVLLFFFLQEQPLSSILFASSDGFITFVKITNDTEPERIAF